MVKGFEVSFFGAEMYWWRNLRPNCP